MMGSLRLDDKMKYFFHAESIHAQWTVHLKERLSIPESLYHRQYFLNKHQ